MQDDIVRKKQGERLAEQVQSFHEAEARVIKRILQQHKDAFMQQQQQVVKQ